MRAIEILKSDQALADVVSEYERTGEEVVIRRDGRDVARMTGPGISHPQILAGEVDIAEVFRRIRERVRTDWPDEPEFDWKAAIDEGRA